MDVVMSSVFGPLAQSTIPVNTAVIGLGVALLANFAGLVWGAAIISAAVRELRTSVDKLDRTVGTLDHAVDTLDKRVAILEDRDKRDRGV